MAIIYWTADQSAEYLKTPLNSFHQMVRRSRITHEKQGHSNNGKCACVLVAFSGPAKKDEGGNSRTHFRADKIKDFALYRKGSPSELGAERALHKTVRDQLAGKISVGRPTNKAKGK